MNIDNQLGRDIAMSWQRCDLSGLTPEMQVDVNIGDFDPDSRLLKAARPVLEHLSDQVKGYSIGGVLVDRSASVVGCYTGNDALRERAEEVWVVPGMTFTEQNTGTNAIATPYETRRPLLVNGEDHYLESFKGFTCYGAPIINPSTRRLEGVLDIMGLSGADSALMRAVVDRAVTDIEQRLLEDYNEEVMATLVLFNSVRRKTNDAVVLLGDDVVLHNTRASGMLTPRDYRLLREAAIDPLREQPFNMLLSSGVPVVVEPVGARAAPGTVLKLRMRDDEAERIPRGSRAQTTWSHEFAVEIGRARRARGHIAIMGESGTGRTFAADAISEGSSAMTVDCSGDASKVLADIEAAVDQHDFLVLDEASLLPPETLRCVELIVKRARHSRFVLILPEPVTAGVETRNVLAFCMTRVELTPLRERMGDFAEIVAIQLGESLGARNSRLTQSALEALECHDWPGNLRELTLVLQEALKRRSVGDITVADLPEPYRRQRPRRRNMSPLERSELNTMQNALAAHRGNKVHTARALGISRSTLYARLRYFGID